MNAPPGLLFVLSISLISTAALCYEILLMRLFAIIQWHHFAYMIISLALLGYGASGTFLAIVQHRIERHFTALFQANAVTFAVSMVGCFAIAQHLAFNPLEIVWDKRQQLLLFAMYPLLAIPFFCAANCIGLAFRRFSGHISRIYRADLLGAGTGAVAVVLILFLMLPENALRLLSGVGLAACVLAGMDRVCRLRGWMIAALIISALLFPVIAPQNWTDPVISPYKGLSQMRHIMGAEILQQRSSPLGQLNVVASEQIPLRIAPGLSMNSRHEPPPQLAVFTDGDGMSAITRFDGRRESLAYLDDLSSALPYHLLPRPNTLILGAGGGAEVLQAIYHDANDIDAVELNPQMIDIVRNDYGEFSGHLYDLPTVNVHIAEARGYLAASPDRYDLIQLALVDSFAAASAGVHALNESYLYTAEAIGEYLDHLSPGGLLAITRWLKLPPRDSLKLFATVLNALEKRGVIQPALHIAMIRSWKTTTLIVKNGEFSTREIEIIKHFCQQRSFDVAYYPGMPAALANRYNILDEPYLHNGAMALLGEERNDFINRYKFHIAPATDDKPYFFHFFQWRVLPELLALRLHGGLPLIEWGYLIVFGTLLQAVAASVVLILSPLMFLRREPTRPVFKARLALYFAALGLAFLFVEIAFIQKFILFLSHPIYSAAVVICAFLIFAGLGAGYAPHFARYCLAKRWPPILVATTGIMLLAVIFVFALPPLLKALIAWPDLMKFAIAMVIIAPLGFLMGMPFPLGLAALADHAPGLIPWAWGINGCASVISAVLATVLAIHFGFSMVVVMAGGCYLVAGVAFVKRL